MKKTTILTLLSLSLVTLGASAQPAKPKDATVAFSIADSATFTGRYKFENMPFEHMDVSVKGNSLVFAGGEYSGPLVPLKDQKDTFDANGEAVFTFVRNSENKVTALKITFQGMYFQGQREEKKS